MITRRLAAALVAALILGAHPAPRGAVPASATAELPPGTPGITAVVAPRAPPPPAPTASSTSDAAWSAPAAAVQATERRAAVVGVASWYATGPANVAAAGPALRRSLGPHWRGTLVLVEANGRQVVVRLGDWCACRTRIIDLPASAFARLAPLSVGVIRVSVVTVAPTPPVTSTLP